MVDDKSYRVDKMIMIIVCVLLAIEISNSSVGTVRTSLAARSGGSTKYESQTPVLPTPSITDNCAQSLSLTCLSLCSTAGGSEADGAVERRYHDDPALDP